MLINGLPFQVREGMWEAQRQGRLRVGSCPTARKQRCGEDSAVFGAVTRPNQLGEGCGQAPPHAQTEEEPSSASRLPAGQAPISGILLRDPSWVSNLGPRGGSTIPGKLSPLGLQGSSPSPRLAPAPAPEGEPSVEVGL